MNRTPSALSWVATVTAIVALFMAVLAFEKADENDGAAPTTTTTRSVSATTSTVERSVAVIDAAELAAASAPLVRLTFGDVVGEYTADGPIDVTYTACRATVDAVLAGAAAGGPIVTICATGGDTAESTGIGHTPPTPGQTAIVALGGTTDVTIGAAPYTATAIVPVTLSTMAQVGDLPAFANRVPIDFAAYKATVG